MDDRRIGRYRIICEHSRGGMGTILQGFDDSLGRTAAIKLLTPERVSSAEALESFRREARAVARLKHPHIAALYEFGEESGQPPYLVMEWVEGVSLQERLVQGPLSLTVACKLLSQILSALDYAHTQGIVHRDIKPANIMLTDDQHITLVDFGLATVLAEPQLSATGPLLGSPLYMPPEIASGENVDGRADLYSASLVFFEMLTGDPAFGPGTVMQIISQQMNAPRPVLSERDPHLPPALDDVMDKALARDPDRRYATGQALMTAVKQACGLDRHDSSSLTARWAFAGLAVVALLAVGGLYLGSHSKNLVAAGQTPAKVPAAAPTVKASPTRDVPSPPSAAPTPGSLEWSIADVDATRSHGLLEVPLQKPVEAWHYPLSGTTHLALAGGLLLASGPEGVTALRAETGQVSWIASFIGTPILSPREYPERILIRQDFGWTCLELSTGKKLWATTSKAKILGAVLSDGDVLYCTAGQRLLAIDPSSGKELWQVDAGAPLSQIPPLIGGFRVMVVDKNHKVRGFDESSRREVWTVSLPSQPSCMAFSPRGALLVGCQDGQVLSYSLVSKEEEWQLGYDFSAVVGIATQPGFSVVACEGGELAAYDDEGYAAWQIPLGDQPAGPPQIDTDVVLVATQTGDMSCFDGETSKLIWTYSSGQNLQAAPLCADDWLFLAGSDKVIATVRP